MRSQIIYSDSHDPWHNLAIEELLFNAREADVIFYLWQNQNTVVVGRNQNSWAECKAELLEREGGRLARRSSGGGAVFHDLGNLCFTFIVPRKHYDLHRQLGVILAAVASLGIQAEFSGRNDLLAGGCKFSGNAFRFGETTALHHGTLLFDADMDKLARYLSPSFHKMNAKGIKSVRARVCNLKDLAPSLTLEALCKALENAFIAEYGPADIINPYHPDPAAFAPVYDKYSSWAWRMGESKTFDVELTNAFDWGELTLMADLEAGHIKRVLAYSDAMDEAFITRLPAILTGVRFTPEALGAALRAAEPENPMAQDVAHWLETME
jgi:lipoate-protein ligase A